MRSFKIDRLAQQEFDEAAAWYEHQEIGLGFEFIEEVDRVVRTEFVHRFPYVVIFVETETMRRVILIRRGNVNPARWRSRI